MRARLARGACFFADLLVENADVAAEELREALWDLVWAGEATNDAFAPLRGRKTAARAARALAGSPLPGGGRRSSGRRFSRRGRGAPPLQGRWSLTGSVFGPGEAVDQQARSRAWAELLLERYGIVTRELVRAEGLPGGFAALYPALSALETIGGARRGYFVEGLGGAQFALPGAVDRLRGLEDAVGGAVVLAAADPAQLYGAALRWPDGLEHPPARRAGAFVVLVDGRPALAVEAGGHGLRTAAQGAALDEALAALAAAVRQGLVPRLAVQKVDGRPVLAAPLADALLAAGFRRGLERLSLAPGDA